MRDVLWMDILADHDGLWVQVLGLRTEKVLLEKAQMVRMF